MSLALHSDLADPNHPDPLFLESTRPTCIAVADGQTSLDPKQRREWIPNIHYGAHPFGIGFDDPKPAADSFTAFLAKREEILP